MDGLGLIRIEGKLRNGGKAVGIDALAKLDEQRCGKVSSISVVAYNVVVTNDSEASGERLGYEEMGASKIT